jgi:predicted glutamine amidotransferase
MCIIAVKPAGIKLSEDTIRNMWDNNDDGAGFMYADRGKVRVVKGLMKLADFMKAYQRVGEHRKIVMHFRIRTHGTISAELTHPFWIRKGSLAMVHNGVISATSHAGISDESDTSLYAKMLAHRWADPLDALTSEAEIQKIVTEIGWSKLVFLTGENEHMIINEKSGDWVDGCWFSNSSHKNNYKRFGNWTSYYTSSDYKGYGSYGEDSGYVWNGTTSTATSKGSGTGSSGFMFGDDDDTKPHRTTTLRDAASADDAEWEALLARYEAKYGSTSD